MDVASKVSRFPVVTQQRIRACYPKNIWSVFDDRKHFRPGVWSEVGGQASLAIDSHQRTIYADPQNVSPILIDDPNKPRTHAVSTAGGVRKFCKRRWPGSKEVWLHVVHTNPNVLFAVLEQGDDSVVGQTVAIT